MPRARLIEMLERRGHRAKGALAKSTIQQHLDILVNTYTTARANDVRALEESLGSRCFFQAIWLWPAIIAANVPRSILTGKPEISSTRS